MAKRRRASIGHRLDRLSQADAVNQQKPWWSITRTRHQSLLMGVLWTVVGLLQLVNLFATDQPSWWRWVIAVLLIGMAGYYTAAWWVRGRREGTDPEH